MRMLGEEARGLDVKPSPYTAVTGSITDRDVVRSALAGVDTVLHTATLHKPHVATHSKQEFLDVNVTGTLTLLEEAVSAGVRAFVFTSTTSVFGASARPGPDRPTAWITEETLPVPRNIYGVTKMAAEELCRLFHLREGLACVVLRTSRFFPEDDDDRAMREVYPPDNLKTNEMLFRRGDIADMASAHLRAAERAASIGFGRYIVSATTPFRREDCERLRGDAPAVLRERVPGYERVYAGRGWRMFPGIDRVYGNEAARRDLAWKPEYDFRRTLVALERGEDARSPLARAVGAKGYHDVEFDEGPYPVEEEVRG